jgi:hypothetical protein
MGTNLPVLHEIDLPRDESVMFAHMNGTQGFLVTQHDLFAANPRDRWLSKEWSYRSIELNDATVSLGTSKKVGNPVNGLMVVWDPAHPSIGYSAIEYVENGKDACYLWTHNFASSSTFMNGSQRKLWEYDREGKSFGIYVSVYICNGELYVIGSRLARLKLDSGFYATASVTPISYSYSPELFGADKVVLPLPPIPELSARQRLEAILYRDRCSLEGDVLCVAQDQLLLAYRLANLTDASATFEVTGHYEETILEKVFGSFRYSGLQLQSGLLYVGNAYGGALFNPHVTVFDARPGHRFSPIAHFAAPGPQMLACPLPGGRALMAGSKVWLVGPPALRD